SGDRGQHRLDRDTSARYELAAGVTHGRAERRGPHQQHGRGPRLHRLGQITDVLLGERDRQVGLGQAQVTELTLTEVGDLKGFEGSVVVLSQEQHVQDSDETAVDVILDLPLPESVPGNSTTIQSTGPSRSTSASSIS